MSGLRGDKMLSIHSGEANELQATVFNLVHLPYGDEVARNGEHNEDAGSLGADSVEDRANVFCPFLPGRKLVGMDGVRGSGSSAIEENQARERGETTKERGVSRYVPDQLKMRAPYPVEPQEIGAVAKHLKGDVAAPTYRVSGANSTAHLDRSNPTIRRGGPCIAGLAELQSSAALDDQRFMGNAPNPVGLLA